MTPQIAEWQPLVSSITSLLAIAISTLTLVWTIYRDAVRKPKLKVTVGVKRIIQKGHESQGPYLFVEALNLGPIANRIGLTFARKNWIRRRLTNRDDGHAMIYPDFEHWATMRPAGIEREHVQGDASEDLGRMTADAQNDIARAGWIGLKRELGRPHNLAD